MGVLQQWWHIALCHQATGSLNPVGRKSGGLAALGVLCLVTVTTALARGLGETYAVFLLPIGHEMGWDRGSLTSVYSVCMAITGMVAPMVGLMLDQLGSRLLYCSGLLALGAGFVLAGLATELWLK